ncbi:hypothetical protein H920_03946 [Fukomys damarensis]|uniref:Uncharacterized protein n=1 Tax=Fukomys damarensis TaxID=885580 RepID=A0A091DVR8_FUKDA|nr:hypothetical protein H920_03946 [Fukomys damarensis]
MSKLSEEEKQAVCNEQGHLDCWVTFGTTLLPPNPAKSPHGRLATQLLLPYTLCLDSHLREHPADEVESLLHVVSRPYILFPAGLTTLTC